MTNGLLPAGSWTIDASRSTVGFAVRHLRVARVRGRFTAFEGRLDAHGAVRVAGTVEAASIDTGEPIRDEHLRSAAFFNAVGYPTVRYAAEQATFDGGRLAGALTIRDVTRPLTLRTTATPGPSASVRITAQGHLSRRDFGLEWDGLIQAGEVAVSDRVDVLVDVLAVREPARRLSHDQELLR
ncbi:MAG TPA: YceI family protein [Thermoleophilaceae bacterium]|nr:YceI family protein [Thermoleophilaceae bacterium]